MVYDPGEVGLLRNISVDNFEIWGHLTCNKAPRKDIEWVDQIGHDKLGARKNKNKIIACPRPCQILELRCVHAKVGTPKAAAAERSYQE